MIVGFIGAGNMGGALATAVAKAVGGAQVMIADRDGEKAAALAEKLGAQTADNETVAAWCDMIFLGVKPQMMEDLLATLAPVWRQRKDPAILVSMAAGVSTATLTRMGAAMPLVRIMPNIPVSVGEGMVLYTTANGVTKEQEQQFLTAMAHAGRMGAVPERLIDAASAVSGCGPAFVYLFIEALADGGVECGLPREQALDYAAQTVLGAAKTVLETGRHPAALKDAVCSPGGTTIAGVHALEQGAFRGLTMDAVVASYEKTLELAQK